MKSSSLTDLIKNKDQLTIPQLHHVVASLKQFVADLGTTPIEVGPLADFATRLSFGTGEPWEAAPHHDYIAEALQDLESGKSEYEGILVMTPPRHGKSLLCSQWFPFWCLCKNPKRRVILTSYEADFAARWGRNVRKLVMERGSEFGLKLDMSTTAAYRWELTTGGGMTTAGAGGPIMGKGANVFIIDDPIKSEEEAASEIMRQKLDEWFETTAYTRREPGCIFVVIATRWNEDDLLGRLKKRIEAGVLKWRIISLPAIAEKDDVLGRKEGELLWPLREKLVMDAKKIQSPYHFSALYQQSPTPEEGNAVKRSWWQMYDVLPTRVDAMIQSWDLAFKDLKKSDYCVGQVWARQGASFFLVEQIRDHMDINEVMAAMRSMSKRYPKAAAKLIEEAANGPAVIQMLQKEIAGMIPRKPKGSKDARLQAVIPYIQAGNVFLPNPQLDGNKWVWEFIEEHAGFPNMAHDDQLDACTQALLYLSPQGWSHLAREAKEARKRPIPDSPIEVVKQMVHDQIRKDIKRSMKRLEQKQRGGLVSRARRFANW